MIGVVLDTSILIAAERGQLDLVQVSADPLEPAAISAVTAHELLRGLARLPAGVRRVRSERWLEALLATIPVADYDVDVARIHAALWVELAGRGRTLGEHDQMIAATAIALGFDLATRDRAFTHIEGLVVRIW